MSYLLLLVLSLRPAQQASVGVVEISPSVIALNDDIVTADLSPDNLTLAADRISPFHATIVFVENHAITFYRTVHFAPPCLLTGRS